MRTVPSLEKILTDEDPACAFWAAWAANLLDSVVGLSTLAAIARSDSPFNERAARLAPHALNLPDVLRLVARLAADAKTTRAAIIGAGFAGDPVRIPWLLERMKEPEHARLAGEAFSVVTGVHLAKANLEGEPPGDFEAGPVEDPKDESVAPDPDEALSWPSAERTSNWWERNNHRFTPGTRHLAGNHFSESSLIQTLKRAIQRKGAAAAPESSSSPLGNLVSAVANKHTP